MARLLTLVAAASTLAACRFASVLAGPFTTPRAVPHKVEHPTRPDARLAVLWVGHATVLLQMDDRRILTDPVFTRTVGQMSGRTVEPGLAVENVQRLDAVLISHLHFDHLSLGSLDLLEDRIGLLLMPESGIAYLPDYRFPVRELRWWERWTSPDGLTVTAVPAKHNGMRYGLDWGWKVHGFCGYVLEYRGQRVYFAGDTGYGPHFREIRERLGPIDLAILPIAPIQPRSLMAPNHVDPVEALDAFRDLGAKRMLAMHFDTFPNSTDAPDDAVRMLETTMRARGLTGDDVLVLGHGEQRIIIPAQPDAGVATPATPP